MNLLLKIILAVLAAILPKNVYKSMIDRAKRTKSALTGTPRLKLFWKVVKVVLWPVNLIFELIFGVTKTLFIWLLPTEFYGGMVFIFKQIMNDLTVRHFGVKLTLKRVSLYFQLFTKGAQRRKSYGSKNPDITFYVIRPYFFLEPNEVMFRNIPNLLTQYYYCLQKLSYAIENGYTPVVDWENYGKLPHSEDTPVNGTMNAWEYYWTQPSEYTLEEVYQSRNVILSTRNIGQFGFIPNCLMAPPLKKYAENLAKKCPRYARTFDLNEVTKNYVNAAYEKLFPSEGRVLGVIVRGTAYGTHRTPYSSHPMQVAIEKLIVMVRHHMEEWEMEYVFFVNEMQELVDAMAEAFGDQLIVLPRLRDHLDRPTDGITQNPMYADGQKYQTNLDYLTEIALLSRCTCLLGSMSSGMRTAIIMNAERYEHMYVIDKGLW